MENKMASLPEARELEQSMEFLSGEYDSMDREGR